MQTYSEIIIRKTVGEIRTFLDELANGTSNYKSLHNLTEQVEHQYHGRFLIELLQNAHDALFDVADPKDRSSSDEGRIEIAISNEPPHGALYIANDGSPFTVPNFDNLSRFGQSDKDPEKHIGNKGIGFRSVLEITEKPEVFSRKERTSQSFDGFNFRFTPEIIPLIEKPIEELYDGNDRPNVDIGENTPLVDWGGGKLRSFRDRCKSLSFEGVISELRYLSPYLLPEPLNDKDKTFYVKQYEEKGFSSVVRLPFKAQEAKSIAIEKADKLDEHTILFLDKARSIWIETPSKKRFITRKTNLIPNLGGAEQIDIDVITDGDDDSNSKKYWLWKWTIGGDEDPEVAEEIRDAVSTLPGKWPSVRKAGMAFAVLQGEKSEKGYISIFLPTLQASGAECHLNAPFYGGMSRTEVDFDQPYNKLLLEKLALKAVDIISNRLVGKGLDEARAILDLLVAADARDSNGNRWFHLVKNTFEELGIDIKKEPLLFTSNDWKSVKKARIPLELDDPRIFTKALFYENATFDVINKGLTSRLTQIKNLFEFLEIDAYPQDDWVAATVELVAEQIARENNADWNDFWHDVMSMFSGKSDLLRGRRVLLGTDGELHASDHGMSVFFRPRSSGDDEEVLPSHTIDQIPSELRSRVAFLHEDIIVQVPREGGGIKNLPLHSYLSSSLVQRFGVETILRNVLIAATPALPASLNGEVDRLCRAIISWGLRLMMGLVDKEKGEKTLKYLGKLPGPCQGGWFPLNECHFGPGWSGTTGRRLKTYLDAVRTPEAKETAKKILLPPADEHWGIGVEGSSDLLEKAGVFDGIRLMKIRREDWSSDGWATGTGGINLPEKPPPNFDQSLWEKYIVEVNENVKPKFESWFQYAIGDLLVIPGMDQCPSLNNDAREDFMWLLLKSISKWEGNWENVWISKQGGSSDTKVYKSPLKYWLKETPWLIDSDNPSSCFRPRDRWFIPPSTILGRGHHFKHLNPLQTEISHILEKDLELSEEFEGLGMPRYQPETKTNSTRLLDDLALALEDPEAISNRDTFFGQVRSAWSLFEPDSRNTFPSRLIVKRGSELKSLVPSSETPVFLPDDTSSFHVGLESYVKNVLAIETKDAKRLGEALKEAFGKHVRYISDLSVQLLVNGAPWVETSVGDFLCETDFKWIVPVLLSCHAHAGNQPRGPHTRAFSNVMDTIRKSHIYWVDSLEVGILEEGECAPVSKIDGIWLSKPSMLIGTEVARENLSLLSEAFSSMMDRTDVEVPLKLVLTKFDGLEEPARESLVGALSDLKIGPEHISEIEQLWLGDLAWTIRLLRPLILATNPTADLNEINSVKSEDSLKEVLEQYDLPMIEQNQILQIVRESNGFYNLGYSLYENIGEIFQLDQWNMALERAGETRLRNENASEQFQNHMDSAQVPLRSIVRKTVRDNQKRDTYTELIDQIERVSVSDNYQYQYWDVPFSQTMVLLKPFLQSWGISYEIINSITDVQDISELVKRLDALGFEPTLDPLEIYAKNRANCLSNLESIQKAGIIWCLRNNMPYDYWDCNISDFMEFVDEALDQEGYLDYWEEDKVFDASKNLPHKNKMNFFWETLNTSESIADLLNNLNIKNSDLAHAEEELEKVRVRDEKKKNAIKVCGTEFDGREDNLSHLFGHIENSIDADTLPDIDIMDLAKLNEIKDKRKRKSVPQKQKRRSKPKGRISQGMKNLVGLAGEIHAYRVLRKKYGAAVVNPSSWVSENSTYVFPGNSVSDDYGCDFKFQYGKKIFYIEVKATQGDEEVFDLGLSEIKKAVEVSNRRKGKYIICHITNALSEEPIFQFLPNPYDRKYSKSYRIFNAGLRIQYQKRTPKEV